MANEASEVEQEIEVLFGFIVLHNIDTGQAYFIKGSTVSAVTPYEYTKAGNSDTFLGAQVWHADNMGHSFLVREYALDILKAVAASYRQVFGR